MDIRFSPEELAFQQEVRDFLANDYPQEIFDKQTQGKELGKDDYVAGQKALHKRGWAAVNWPVEYGGTGWTPIQKYIFNNEMAAAGAAQIIPFGMTMVAPVIINFGTEEQKKRFLPDILESNVWWCQGYSEPNAGSDLANVRTKAVRDGDHYVINGQKTWTTMAQWADWIFCLVRTDSSGKPQEGISFVLVDMNTPGVTVRPIQTIDGGYEINDVFFEDVRVPVENCIGEEGKGWSCAKFLLTYERTNIAGVAKSKLALKKLKKAAASVTGDDGTPLIDDPAFIAKISRLEIKLTALEYTELRLISDLEVGKVPGAESSHLKIRGSEIQQEIAELLMETAGYYSLPYLPEHFEAGWNGEPVGPDFAAASSPRYFNLRKTTIYGGSSEIQKGIIAKAVLGL